MKEKGFVVINNIVPHPGYQQRMEDLFCTRKRAIDKIAGFRSVRVLKPRSDDEAYLVISEWDRESDFQKWTASDAFHEGHRRAFADIEQAKRENKPEPMKSQLKLYDLLSE